MRDVCLFPDGTLATDAGMAIFDPLPCLGRFVRLEPGCSLRSFFAMLGRYPVLMRLGEFLESAAAEASACPLQGCQTPLLAELELQKTVRLIGFPGEPRLEIQTVLHGLAGGERQEVRFFGFEALLDLPLRLGKVRHEVLGDTVALLECDTTYGLFECIDALAWELGFHHVPQHCTIKGVPHV